mgnify:CR=1 FL=1
MNKYYVILSSGLYTIEAADDEDAAWLASDLSKDVDSPLLDVVSFNETQKALFA